MRTKSWMGSLLVLLALVVGCASDRSVPPDEARAKYPAEDYSTPAGWKVAAEKHYPPAAFDYFEDMDAIGTADVQGARKLSLAPEEIKGRNAWVMWAAG